MHDIRVIRQDPEAFERALASRGHAVSAADIVALDEARRDAHGASQASASHVAGFGKTLGQAKALGDEARAAALMEELAAARERSRHDLRAAADGDAALKAVLRRIPCVPVPGGAPPAEAWSRPEPSQRRPDAFDAAESLCMSAWTGVSDGAMRKQVLLTGRLAAMQRAVGQLAAATHAASGWTEAAPPAVVEATSSLGGPDGGLPVTEGFEPLLAILNDERFLGLAASGLFSLVGERRVPRGPGRDRGTVFLPDGPSVAVVRSHGGEPDALEAALDPARAVLDALGVAHRTREVSLGDLAFHEARALVLEARRDESGYPLEVGRVADASDFLSRRMGIPRGPQGPRRGGAFPRLLLGTALSIGGATRAAVEANASADGVAVPPLLAPFLGGGPVARAG